MRCAREMVKIAARLEVPNLLSFGKCAFFKNKVKVFVLSGDATVFTIAVLELDASTFVFVSLLKLIILLNSYPIF